MCICAGNKCCPFLNNLWWCGDSRERTEWVNNIEIICWNVPTGGLYSPAPAERIMSFFQVFMTPELSACFSLLSGTYPLCPYIILIIESAILLCMLAFFNFLFSFSMFTSVMPWTRCLERQSKVIKTWTA